MTDTKPLTTPPYFRDSNGNGTLDGSEIIAALNREALPDKKRAPNQHAYNTLVKAGLLKITDEELEKTNGSADFGVIAQRFVDSLVSKITDILVQERHRTPAQMREDARLRTALLPEKDRAQALAESLDMIEFAEQFPKNFPQGVGLSAPQMIDILNHFGNVAVATIPAPTGTTNRIRGGG